MFDFRRACTVKLRSFVNTDHSRQLACPLHVTSPRDLCTWSLDVTLACDLTLWPLHVALVQLSSLAELTQLNTSSRFRQKHNFFRASKIHSISTWRITWLHPFTLSISFDQPSVFVIRLTVLQQSIRAIDFVLDHSYFKEQIVRSIPKIQNNTENNYNQIKRHAYCSRWYWMKNITRVVTLPPMTYRSRRLLVQVKGLGLKPRLKIWKIDVGKQIAEQSFIEFGSF